jgi:polyisoprenoid-binding protein YceI
MIRCITFASLALVTMPLYAATYTIDPDHAQGVFRWNHLGFSNPAAQFSQGTGTLEFDQTEPTKSSVAVTIPLSSLQSGLPELDEHLRSESFFNITKFPSATFKSTKVKKDPATGHLKITGDLDLHGVTKSVTLDAAVVKVGINPRNNVPEVGFDATTTIRRSDFGLGKYVPQVGDEIPMRIIIEAYEAKPYAEYLKEEAAKEAAAKAGAKK